MADVRNPPADIETSESFQEKSTGAYDESGKPTSYHTASYADEVEKLAEVKGDPFPIDDTVPVEDHQLTVRALVVGCVLGAVVGASNIYLGLKTGFTFGPQLFGAIFGFVALKWAAPIIGGHGPGWLVGDKKFGPKENVTVQTAATSAGGIGIIFVGAIPAMYRLNLLSEQPSQDIGKLIALTICVAYYGVFFVIPLRKYYVLKQKLVFPTPSATAYTIRSLHTVGGEIAARKKAIMLSWSFCVSFVWKVVSSYAPGIMWDWHVGWTLYRLGFTSMIKLDNWGWWLEFTPAFFGAGMLSGMNASWSFFGGAVLAWGIIGPATIATGLTFGTKPDPDNRVSYQSLKFNTVETGRVSPRYWLLWPGVLIMIVYSFFEVGLSSRRAIRRMFSDLGTGSMGRSWRNFRNRNDPNFIREVVEDDVVEPCAPEDLVPLWAWTSGLLVSVIITCAVASTQFGLNVGEVILALIFGFLFSFLAVQSAGDTDINPVSTVAKASQLIFGGIGKGQNLQTATGEMHNLVAGVLAGGSAAQATDMTGDLKTGHLLSAKPKNQFVAQLTGATVAVFLNVGLFVLFCKSAPCILHLPESGECTYGAPSVAAWAAVAQAVAAPKFPVPRSSGLTAIGLSIAAALTVLAKHLWIPKKYWNYIPNWNAIGLGFVVPQVYYPIAMIFGATFVHIWEHKSPMSFEMYGFALAAGLVAGEGMGGVLSALLAVANVAGDRFGTAIGCPGLEYCG